MKQEKPLPVLYSLHRVPVPFGNSGSAVSMEKSGAVLYWMDTRELEDEFYFSEYYKTMSYERQRKVDSYTFMKDKRLSLGAGILTDRGLSAYGLCGRDAAVSYGKNGKPYLLRYPHIHFNLSHSGSRALAVFAEMETGCDIERIQKADLALAERFFTPKEYAFIAEQKGRERQDEAFFRLWTLKESFLKAVGEGLMLSLDAFEITISPDGEIGVCRKTNEARALCPGEFAFREYRMGEYCAAVCLWEK